MSNWREDSDRPRKKSSKMPVVRRPATPSPEVNDSSARPANDWKGKKSKHDSSRADQTSSGSSRTWTNQTKPVEIGPLRKLLVVLLLGLSITGLTGYFVWFILKTDPKVPFFVCVTSTHSDPYLSENPFGHETAKHLFAISKTIQKNVRLLSHAGSLSSLSSIDDIRGSDLLLSAAIDGQEFKPLQYIPSSEINDNERKRWFGTSGKLRGGGPGKNIVGFFVSCLASISTDKNGKEQAVLLLNDSHPFRSERMLTASQLFEFIAQSIEPDCFAWIALDCKSPTVIANIRDLQPPIGLIKEAWESLKPEWRNKLIVTLPCDEGEQNCIAPELGSSAFSHSFLQGIHTGFQSGAGGSVSLGQFREGLVRTVSNWSANHREAAQHPQFLIPTTIADRDDSVLLFSTAQNAPIPDLVNSTGVSYEDLDWCDDQWELLHRLSFLANKQPIVYSRVEASLLQLEDLAEFGANAGSGNLREKLRASCKEDLEYLKRLAERPRVSLIESRSMQSKSTLAEWENDKQDWLRFVQSRIEKTSAPDVTPESNVLGWDNDRKAHAFWMQLEEWLRVSDQSARSEYLTKDKLERQLKAVGDAASVDWIEIQVVRNLLSDLDWDDASKDTTTFAAAFLRAFATLQRVQCEQGFEAAGWFNSKTNEAHKGLLSIYDGYASTKLSDADAFSRLQQYQKGLEKLLEYRIQISNAIEMRDSSLRIAPHLLSFWARRYLTGKEEWANSYLDQVSEVGSLVSKAADIAQRLKADDKETLPDGFSSLLVDLQLSYSKCISDPSNSLNKRIADIVRSGSQDQESLQLRRDLLRWPLLPADLRKVFHQDLKEFYSQNRTTSVPSSESKLSGRSLSPFIEKLRSSFTATSRQSPMLDVLRDVALGNLTLAFQSISETDTTSSSSLYQSRLRCLPLAVALGHRSAGLNSDERRTSGLNENQPSWTAPYVFFREQQCKYYLSQQKNLFVARWGNGSIESKKRADLYFVKLADRYQLSVDSIDDEVWMAAIPDSLKESKEVIKVEREQSAESILSLKIQPEKLARNKLTGSDKVNSQITWTNIGTKDLASIYLGRRAETPPYKTTSWLEPPRIVPLSFGDATNSKMNVVLPKINLLENNDSALADGWVLSFRGHYRIHPILLNSPGKTIAIDFKKRPPSKASVQVKAVDLPSSKIFVLLDCSGSMTEGWDGMGEAKQAVIQLLEHLEGITNEGGAVFDISVVLFGFSLKSADNPKFNKVWSTVSPKDVGKNYGEQLQQNRGKYSSRNLKPIIDSLRSPEWDEMRIGGRTPLYNAMLFAAEQLKGNVLPQPRIIILTDGENNPPKEKDVDTQPQQLIDALGGTNKKARVQIYFSDKKESLKPETAQELRLFLQDDTDLKPITEFDNVGRQLVESIPKSTVVLLAKDGQPITEGSFQQELSVDPALLPFDGSIEVRTYLQTGAAIQKSWNIRLSENERLRFEYDGTKGELRPITFEKDTIDGVSDPKRRTEEFPVEFISEDAMNLPFVLRGRHSLGREKNRKLTLQAAVMGTKPEKESTQLFERFPLVLSRVTPVQPTSPTLPFLFGNWNHESTHYPVFTSPGLPWSSVSKDNSRQLISKDLLWDVWCFSSLPKEAMLIRVDPQGSTDKQPPLDVQISRGDRDIRVRTTPSLENRYFVLGSELPKMSWSSDQLHEMRMSNNPSEDEIEAVEEEYTFPTKEGVPFQLLLVPLRAVESPNEDSGAIHFRTRRPLSIQP